MLSHRRSVLVGLISLGLTGCQQALRPLADSDRNAIRAAVATFDKAIVDRDWKRIASLYTADGMVIPPDGPVVQGRAAIERYFSGFPVLTSFRQDILETDGVGTLAYARATDADSGKVLTIWRKQPDNSWLVTHGMWSPNRAVRP